MTSASGPVTTNADLISDPESYTWDPLDGELTKKLDERPYVSLSRDRRLAAQGLPESSEVEAAEGEINDEEMSLFDIHMPGVMTLDEVKPLDLDHSLLLVQGSLVHMMVRRFRYSRQTSRADMVGL
jgi:arginine-tRNA-protein transferase